MEEMLKWLKFMGLQEAKTVIENAVSHEDEKTEQEQRIVYELTDGEHSSRDITERISHSKYWVTTRQNRWAKLGILEKPKPNSSYQHIVSLEEAGLECPDIPSPEDEEQVEKQQEGKDQAKLTEATDD